MTPADIILIAQEAGVEVGFNDWRATNDALVKFAALVAAAEREACALAVRQTLDDAGYATAGYIGAVVIRARGTP